MMFVGFTALICRYEHKFLCPVPVRCLSSLKGSKHIILIASLGLSSINGTCLWAAA